MPGSQRDSMNNANVMLNETFGWISITSGFVTGTFLGLRFHDDNWLGGYASFKRRMLRLGHISLFGLGAINLLFVLSLPRMSGPPLRFELARWGFLVGGVAMPMCCALTAWRMKLRTLFVVPVASLLTAGLMTLFGVLGL